MSLNGREVGILEREMIFTMHILMRGNMDAYRLDCSLAESRCSLSHRAVPSHSR